MNEKQTDQLDASIERTGNGIVLAMLACLLVGSCVAEHVGDKITTEIHDTGLRIAHGIQQKE